MQRIKPFDIVALLDNVPDLRLIRGRVGTIVEELPPDSYEVEFADDDGDTYASLGLRASQLLLLRTHAVEVA